MARGSVADQHGDQQRSVHARALLLLGLCCRAAAMSAGHMPDERLIGWLGETYRPGDQPGGSAQDPSGLQAVSWDPRIFHYRRLLSEEECDYIRTAAMPKLTRSGVSDSLTGRNKTSSVRTSSGMFFDRGHDEVIAKVEQRIAMVTMLPADHAEAMQVLRYENGQEYKPHMDYFSFEARDANGGNRIATVLMYLTDVDEGGETVFPRVPKAPHQTLGSGWSNCSLQGLAVRARKGDATIFWSLRPDGTLDPKSLHGSCPVLGNSEKWSATKWFHLGHFAEGNETPQEVRRVIHAPSPPLAPSWCNDARKECAVWAESGECDANPAYMVGTKAKPGSCLASCGRCDLLATARKLLPQR